MASIGAAFVGAFIFRLWSINGERVEEEVVVGAERERKRKGAYFTENTMLRGSSVDKVLNQVLADSDAEGEYSPSDDGVQSSDRHTGRNE